MILDMELDMILDMALDMELYEFSVGLESMFAVYGSLQG